MPTILLGLPAAAVIEADRAEISRIFPDARLVISSQHEAMAAVLPDVEIAAAGVPPRLIVQAPRLRWFQQWGAGADWLARHPEAATRDFILTNTSGLHAIPISEHILALLLAFARRLPAAIRAQQRGVWERQEGHVFELAGKTLLLIGVGAIGERTATLASALGLRVLGIRRDGRLAAAGVTEMAGPDRLHAWLPQADFVVLTVPLTPETRQLIGAAELRLMRPTAYLVNIGRGGTVDEAALVKALQAGRIAGAGLDVFATEPLPADSPLWRMEQVIITAHYAGNTPVYNPRAMAIFLDNLRRFRDGAPLRNVVDKQLGY